jgi:hypothetical protein
MQVGHDEASMRESGEPGSYLKRALAAAGGVATLLAAIAAIATITGFNLRDLAGFMSNRPTVPRPATIPPSNTGSGAATGPIHSALVGAWNGACSGSPGRAIHVEFGADGSWFASADGAPGFGLQYTIQGNEFRLESTGSAPFYEDYSYSLNGNQLTYSVLSHVYQGKSYAVAPNTCHMSRA